MTALGVGGSGSRDASPRPMRLAYFFTDLPVQAGTFPLAEIEAMLDRGIEIEIYCLRSRLPKGPMPEFLVRRTLVHRAPYLDVRTAGAVLRFLVTRPAPVLTSLARAIADTAGNPRVLVKTLAIFPKCCLFARDLQRRRVDLLWAYWASIPGRAAWWISILTGVPYGTWAHAGNDIYDRRHQTDTALRTIVSGASLCCTCNEANVRHFRTILSPQAMAHVHLLPHGIDLAQFEMRTQGLPETTSARTDNRPAPGVIRLLSVGRLGPAKGFQHAIEACDLLRKRGLRVHYRIIGEGRLRQELTARIASLGLESNVILTGAIEQHLLPHEYRHADILVMPSVIASHGDRDGLPNVLLEAMSCGLPCIGSDALGIPEAIRNGETGLLVPPGDPTALALAIERLAEDPAGARRMALAARRLVEERYARSECLNQLAQLFQRVTTESSTRRGRKSLAAAPEARLRSGPVVGMRRD